MSRGEVDLRKVPKRQLRLTDKMGFGKHRELTVEVVMITEPSYITWALANVDWFDLTPDAHKKFKEYKNVAQEEKRYTREEEHRDIRELFDDPEADDDEAPF